MDSSIDSEQQAVVEIRALSHCYRNITAVDRVDLTIGSGITVGLVGADGVGKSTLLSLIAGTRIIQQGSVRVFGRDLSQESSRNELSRRIAFMPQGLGKNLYPTLSVRENISFHADLFGLRGSFKSARINRLLAATSLSAFADRAAGKLSGGMKQKLSLCCALIHSPDLLILDEPTTGVDPLSRRQFWQLVSALMKETPGMTVIISTAYIDEAEGFDHTLMMDSGRIIADRNTRELMAEYGAATLEEAYMKILPPEKRGKEGGFIIPPLESTDGEVPAIKALHLTKKFGGFTAVNDVSFEISRGEIFGFLGSNGCGKSTTMKMLTGLLEPTGGEALIMGETFTAGDSAVKRKVGYMSQAFSLYEELTVTENLFLHAKLYHIPILERYRAIRSVLERFGLYEYRHTTPKSLSLGIKQRLQLAAACLHNPEILILDEPTSGVDPAARDLFWEYLIKLSREEHVTIFVSTHFMNEAERCDRISLMHRGRVLAIGSPDQLRRNKNEKDLEQAFIRYLEEQSDAVQDIPDSCVTETQHVAPLTGLLYSLAIIRAFAVREYRELSRDLVRLFFVIFGSLIFEICASFGISFDMTQMPFGVIDHDQSAQSRALLQEFTGSAYFKQRQIEPSDPVIKSFQKHHIKLLIEIPPRYGEKLLRGEKPEIGFFVDGAFPTISSNVRNYVNGIMDRYNAVLRDPSGHPLSMEQNPLEIRFMYNEIFKSVYVMVPGLIMMVLVMFPAMMTALGVVREKDLGTISNLNTSPARVYQFLLGKQLPYVALSLLSFMSLVFCAVFVLGVPIRGSFPALLLGAVLMILASTAFGLLVSCFVETQIAAIFASAIFSMLPAINFSGFLFPISTLEGAAYYFGKLFPCSWFETISLGCFTKGLSFDSFGRMYLCITLMGLTYLTLSCLILRKQEK